MKSVPLTSCLNIRSVFQKLRKIPKADFRDDIYKNLREAWCTARMLKEFGWNPENYLLYINPLQADSMDNAIINSHSGQILHNIQVVEIAPKNSDAVELLGPYLGNGYSNLKEEIFTLTMTSIQRKEEKYSTADKKGLNLLIYFNPPTKGDWCIIEDHELDLDLPKLQKAANNSEFGSIVFLSSDGIAFLKNTQLV